MTIVREDVPESSPEALFPEAKQRERRRRAVYALAAVLIAAAGSLIGVAAIGGFSSPPPARASGTAPGGSGPAAVTAATSASRWQQEISSNLSYGRLTCPSTSACYTLSANYVTAPGTSRPSSWSLYESSDFGVRWSRLSLPRGVETVTELSCSNDLDCALGGTVNDRPVLVRTTNGGRQWSVAPLTGRSGVLTWLACASSAWCYGVLEKVTSTSTSPPSLSVRSLAPVPIQQSLVTTTNGGVSWTSSSVPAGSIADGLACATTSTCLVLGTKTNETLAPLAKQLSIAYVALLRSIRQALSTSKELIGLPDYPVPPLFVPRLAALPNAIRLFVNTVTGLKLPAVDAAEVKQIVRAGDAMKQDIRLNAVDKLPVNQWSDDNNVLGLAERTIDEQLSNETFALRTTDGGAKWTKQSLPVTNLARTQLTCSSASVCAATASPFTTPVVLVTTDGGLTWRTRTIAAKGIRLANLSEADCASATTCWVTGTQARQVAIGNSHFDDFALIAGTTNGGSTWSAVPISVPANLSNSEAQSYEGVGPLSCPAVNACLAFGVPLAGSPTTLIFRLVG